ncbi:amidase [Bradyrhizobium sp. Tv2a-2]|uniref:amidase n=1 Tax=Bradyrhizobium sp. Tv2a-2 TaxID=113395 RepID=UPI00041EAC94|nr:amidase [Bradyrhizobium sp. Tv2a-2]
MISLSDLTRRIDRGELSPEAALAESLGVIEAQEPTIGAFVHRARNPRAAGEGPLRGIAVAIKDIIDTSDLPTEMGSSIYKGWQPRADASVVIMLKRAGATVVGKTTTTAFAALDPTATLNPRNHGHTPGGSSAGSAAAVAAGMVPLALGTQTAGSVIRPASFCGVAAIKPSYRLLPSVGVKCYSWTLDTVGLFAAGVEDLAVALAAMTERPELARYPLTEPLRIGVVTQDFAGSVEAASDAALRIAAAAADKAGAGVRVLELAEVFAEAWDAQAIIQDFEAHRALAWEYQTHHDEIAPKLRAKMDETAGIAPSAHVQALAVANRARAAFDGALADADVILTYSAPGVAPKGLASTGEPRFNRLWTLLGVPCVNVTADIADGGLSVGVQIVARFGEDAKALAAARFLEDALRK